MLFNQHTNVGFDLVSQFDLFLIFFVDESCHDIVNLVLVVLERIEDLEIVDDEAELWFKNEKVLNLLVVLKRGCHNGNQHVHHGDDNDEWSCNEE